MSGRSFIHAAFTPFTMVLFADLASRISRHADLYNSISNEELSMFCEAATRFLPTVTLLSPRTTVGVPSLPSNVRDTLILATQLPPRFVDMLWATLGDLIIQEGRERLATVQQDVDAALANMAPSHNLGQLSLRHGLPQGLR